MYLPQAAPTKDAVVALQDSIAVHGLRSQTHPHREVPPVAVALLRMSRVI
jgi:hypothetical protein